MKLTYDIPEAVNGRFEIKKVTADIFGVPPTKEPLDTYTVLHNVGCPIMQDTTKEYREHQPLWDNATGHVLIGGLGIGFVNQKLMDNPNVTSVTIVEKYQEVIDLVWPYCPKDDTFTLIHADIDTWQPTQKFDCIWLDTWIGGYRKEKQGPYDDYYEKLVKKYQPHCDWIWCWNPNH